MLQTWWTKNSLNDPWWAELLQELATFMRPENWIRCQIQLQDWASAEIGDASNSYVSDMTAKTIYGALALSYWRQPIHVAAPSGLLIMIDLLHSQASQTRFSSVWSIKPTSELKHRRFKYVFNWLFYHYDIGRVQFWDEVVESGCQEMIRAMDISEQLEMLEGSVRLSRRQSFTPPVVAAQTLKKSSLKLQKAYLAYLREKYTANYADRIQCLSDFIFQKEGDYEYQSLKKGCDQEGQKFTKTEDITTESETDDLNYLRTACHSLGAENAYGFNEPECSPKNLTPDASIIKEYNHILAEELLTQPDELEMFCEHVGDTAPILSFKPGRISGKIYK